MPSVFPYYQCTVKKFLDKGVSVELSGWLSGFIAKMHLADVTLNNPEQKFKEGQKLKCRVSKMSGNYISLQRSGNMQIFLPVIRHFDRVCLITGNLHWGVRPLCGHNSKKSRIILVLRSVVIGYIYLGLKTIAVITGKLQFQACVCKERPLTASIAQLQSIGFKSGRSL